MNPRLCYGRKEWFKRLASVSASTGKERAAEGIHQKKREIQAAASEVPFVDGRQGDERGRFI